ncbi:SPOR domain-containing protein [Geosporobacter ferrireducens]|uniref:SPOR domain-containing protein n=1 Tax=Geosporobacter ferrireducens TaxID=1424294 RepID=UPI0023557676|nr:SPOR domain-containing protein [Geosporobacter ferrireducens]
MRQTRLKTSREYKGRNIGIIIAFALLLPVIAISLGYIGTKYIVIPNILSKQELSQKKEMVQENREQPSPQESANTNAETTQEAYASTFEIQGFTIHGIQLGSFSTTDNAQVLMDTLRKENFGVYLWHKDGFKVISIALMDRNEVDKVLPKVKAFDENAFVVTTNIPVRAVKYNKDDAKYTLLLSNENRKLIEIYQQLSKQISEDYINQNIKDLEKISQQIQQVKEIKEEIEKSAPTAELGKLNAAYIAMLDQMIVGLEESLILKDQNAFIRLQNTFTSSLYQYYSFATSDAY